MRGVGARLCGAAWLLQAACTEDIRLHSDAGRAESSQDAGSALPPTQAGPSTPRADAACDSSELAPLAAALPRDACAPLASSAFGHALCTCDTLQILGQLSAAAFDSELGAFAPGQAGAALGSQGNLFVAKGLELLGTLTVSGSSVATWSDGHFHVSDTVQVDRDLALDRAEAQLDGALLVSRNIVLNASSLSVAGPAYQGGRLVGMSASPLAVMSRDVHVEPPCPCSSVVSAELVQLRQRLVLDDAAAAQRIGADALRQSELELGCGRFLVDAGTLSSAHWTVRGASMLFVDGVLEIGERLVIDFEAGASLDVFVRADLRLHPGARLETARPGALRFYVGGRSGLSLQQGARFTGNLYAPAGLLTLDGPQTIEGSLVVQSVVGTDSLELHYDRSVLRTAADADSCKRP